VQILYAEGTCTEGDVLYRDTEEMILRVTHGPDWFVVLSEI